MILDGVRERAKGPVTLLIGGSTPRTAEGAEAAPAAEEPEERMNRPEGLRGADRLAAVWAADRRVDYQRYPADWENDRRQAGVLRNEWMLEDGRPHLVVVFPTDGENGGARHMAELAADTGTPVENRPTTSAATTRSTTRPPPTTSRPSARR